MSTPKDPPKQKPLSQEEQLQQMQARIDELHAAEQRRQLEAAAELKRKELQAQIDQRKAELDALEATEAERLRAHEAEEAAKQEAANVTKLSQRHPRAKGEGDEQPALRLRRLYGR